MRRALAGVGAVALVGTSVVVTLPWTSDNPKPTVVCPLPESGIIGEIELEVEGATSEIPCPDSVTKPATCFHSAAWFNCYNVEGDNRKVGVDRTVIFVPEPGIGVMLLAGVMGLVFLRRPQ